MPNMIHEETRDGFKIRVYTEPEQDDPRGHFATGDDAWDAGTVAKIESGEFAWFMVDVQVSKNDIVLGHSYLGACCYGSEAEFIAESGYYEDLANEAIDEAKQALAGLCN